MVPKYLMKTTTTYEDLLDFDLQAEGNIAEDQNHTGDGTSGAVVDTSVIIMLIVIIGAEFVFEFMGRVLVRGEVDRDALSLRAEDTHITELTDLTTENDTGHTAPSSGAIRVDHDHGPRWAVLWRRTRRRQSGLSRGANHSRRRRCADGRGVGWRGRNAKQRPRRRRRGCVKGDKSVRDEDCGPVRGDGWRPLQGAAVARRCMERAVGRKGNAWRVRACAWMMLTMLAGWRIGEASNPGPWGSQGDDSEPESVRQALGNCDPWAAAPCWEADYGCAPSDYNSDGMIGNELNYFTLAANFTGEMTGFVYKLGLHGLGYYRDRRPSAQALGGTEGGTVMLKIDELVPEGGSMPHDERQPTDERDLAGYGGAEADACGHGTRGEASHPNEASMQQQSPMWMRKRARKRRAAQDEHFELADKVSAGDRTHRKAGLWAIDTVNPNAWPAAASYLERTAADIVAVQETRRLRPNVGAAEREARRLHWKLSMQAADRTEAGRASAGVAIGTRAHIGIAKAKRATHDDGLSSRLQARLVGAVVRGGVPLLSQFFTAPKAHRRRT